MGENVLYGQVKSFEKGADRSLAQMSSPTLFERPQELSSVFNAEPMNGCPVSQGDHLNAHASVDGRSVLLAKGHVAVARIVGDGAIWLLEALCQPGNSGIIPMETLSVSPVSGFIRAQIAGGEDASAT